MKSIYLTLLFGMFSFLLASELFAQKAPGFDRGFSKKEGGISTFVPKGSMNVGLSASYHSYNAGSDEVGYEFMSLVTDIKGQLTTLTVSPSYSYAFAKNTTVGVMAGYSYTFFNLDDAQISMGEDSDLDMSNHYLRSNKYMGAATLRYYLPLFNSKIFALFYEARLTGSYSEGKSFKLDDAGDKDGTFTKSYGAEFGLYPGISCFVTNNIALEVALNVLKVGYNYSDQTKNQVEKSHLSNFGTGYKVQLTSLNFGLLYYFKQNK
ncbi:MAG: hypothetical protein WCS67_03155 [Bacteroidales bacterium]